MPRVSVRVSFDPGCCWFGVNWHQRYMTPPSPAGGWAASDGPGGRDHLRAVLQIRGEPTDLLRYVVANLCLVPMVRLTVAFPWGRV